MDGALFFAVLVVFAVGQPLMQRWIGGRWVDERLSNVSAVLPLLLTSGVGIGLLLVVALAVMHPSADAIPVLLGMFFVAFVIFGFGMTAITYASAHGVREHLRTQRAKKGRP